MTYYLIISNLIIKTNIVKTSIKQQNYKTKILSSFMVWPLDYEGEIQIVTAQQWEFVTKEWSGMEGPAARRG